MFGALPEPRPDALMLVSRRFRADNRANKLDLGVGVYRDAEGRASILDVVKHAEALIVRDQPSKAYLPADGDADFVTLMREMVLGTENNALKEQRVAAAQCPGGTGSLHQALALLKRAGKDPVIWVGTPTWPNHIPMIGHQNFAIETYDYFDIPTQSLKFDQMMSALAGAKPGDVVLLHGVCHNPTGADLDHDQWQQVVELVRERALIPLFDFAYQGFGKGSDADAAGVRLMSEQVPELMIAASCSKSFGLYRERTGILIVQCDSRQAAEAVTGSLQTLARLNYSNPPDHGGAIVRTILSDPDLKSRWTEELQEMRERVQSLRHALVKEGQAQSCNLDFTGQQTGLFTTFALTEEQVTELAESHAIHMPATGRINMSGLSITDIPRFVTALRSV